MNCFLSRRLKERVREWGQALGQDPHCLELLEVLSASRTPGFGPLLPVTMEGQTLQRLALEAALAQGAARRRRDTPWDPQFLAPGEAVLSALPPVAGGPVR
jgi:hypothetical protein